MGNKTMLRLPFPIFLSVLVREARLGAMLERVLFQVAAKAESRPGHVKIDPRCGSDRGVSRSVVDLPERGDS